MAKRTLGGHAVLYPRFFVRAVTQCCMICTILQSSINSEKYTSISGDLWKLCCTLTAREAHAKYKSAICELNRRTSSEPEHTVHMCWTLTLRFHIPVDRRTLTARETHAKYKSAVWELKHRPSSEETVDICWAVIQFAMLRMR